MGSLPKNKRIEDEELLETVRTIPCLACGSAPPSDAHHIKTKKSGGDDVAANVISLCREHHSQWHTQGTAFMAESYPVIKTWLELAGWKIVDRRRWRR